MKCPLDETELMMTERSGIEIDYCPKCRGVWLDRGELDKIIERAAEPPPAARVREEPAPAQPGRPWQEPARDGYRHGKEFGRGDGRRHDDDDDDRRGRGRRRGSILDDLFDF